MSSGFIIFVLLMTERVVVCTICAEYAFIEIKNVLYEKNHIIISPVFCGYICLCR